MPTVESRDDGTLLTFQRKHVAQNVAGFVAERDAVNTQKLADVFRVSRKTIQRETQPLAALGLIEWIGSDGTGFWQEK